MNNIYFRGCLTLNISQLPTNLLGDFPLFFFNKINEDLQGIAVSLLESPNYTIENLYTATLHNF